MIIVLTMFQAWCAGVDKLMSFNFCYNLAGEKIRGLVNVEAENREFCVGGRLGTRLICHYLPSAAGLGLRRVHATILKTKTFVDCNKLNLDSVYFC